MYGLLSRIPNGLEDLRNKFEQHVKKAGIEAVKKILPAPGAVTETGKPEVLVSHQSLLSDILLNNRTPKHMSRLYWPYMPNTTNSSTVLSELNSVSTVVSIE